MKKEAKRLIHKSITSELISDIILPALGTGLLAFATIKLFGVKTALIIMSIMLRLGVESKQSKAL